MNKEGHHENVVTYLFINPLFCIMHSRPATTNLQMQVTIITVNTLFMNTLMLITQK